MKIIIVVYIIKDVPLHIFRIEINVYRIKLINFTHFLLLNFPIFQRKFVSLARMLSIKKPTTNIDIITVFKLLKYRKVS